MNSIYQCTPEFSDAKDIYTPPVLRFRADCRGAGGNFQNLTLFDGSRVCGQLSYRKYGNSSDIVSPTTRWLPLTYDYIVTMEKEDILDIECVPYHLRFGMSLSRVKESVGHVKAESWMLPFSLLMDGHKQVHDFFQPISTDLLLYPNSDANSCAETLGRAYDWKMNLTKSINFSHWVSYSSPALAPLPEIFPKVDLGHELRGEIFHLDKDMLHLTVREATIYSKRRPKKSSKKWLVKVDPNFYGSSSGLNSFAVDFKLEVNSEGFPRDADEVRSSWDSNIIEGCRRVPLPKPGITLLFNLTLPVNTAGMQDDSKSRSLVIIVLVLILIFLVANLGYFYWKQRRTMQSVQSQAGLNPAMSIEMQEADASWWGKPAHFRKPFRHVAVLLQELSINCRIHPAWLRGPDLHIVRFVTRRLLFSIIINKIGWAPSFGFISIFQSSLLKYRIKHLHAFVLYPMHRHVQLWHRELLRRSS